MCGQNAGLENVGPKHDRPLGPSLPFLQFSTALKQCSWYCSCTSDDRFTNSTYHWSLIPQKKVKIELIKPLPPTTSVHFKCLCTQLTS